MRLASTATFVRRWPRATAALSFGLAGCLLPAVWFLPSVISRRDGVAFVLYVVLPGLSAALAGALFGAPICDPARTTGQRGATVRGAFVAAFALVIFAPTFATLFAATAKGSTNIFGLTVLVLTFSGVAMGWVVIAVGGVVGSVLYQLASFRDAV